TPTLPSASAHRFGLAGDVTSAAEAAAPAAVFSFAAVFMDEVGPAPGKKRRALYHRPQASNMPRCSGFPAGLTFVPAQSAPGSARYGFTFGGTGGSSRISVMVTRRLAAI